MITEALLEKHHRKVTQRIDQATRLIVEKGTEKDYAEYVQNGVRMQAVDPLNVMGTEADYEQYIENITKTAKADEKNPKDSRVNLRVDSYEVQYSDLLFKEIYEVNVDIGEESYTFQLRGDSPAETIAKKVLNSLGIVYIQDYAVTNRAYDGMYLGEYLQEIFKKEGYTQINLQQRNMPNRYGTHPDLQTLENDIKLCGQRQGLEHKFKTHQRAGNFWVNPFDLKGVYVITNVSKEKIALENIQDSANTPTVHYTREA